MDVKQTFSHLSFSKNQIYIHHQKIVEQSTPILEKNFYITDLTHPCVQKIQQRFQSYQIDQTKQTTSLLPKNTNRPNTYLLYLKKNEKNKLQINHLYDESFCQTTPIRFFIFLEPHSNLQLSEVYSLQKTTIQTMYYVCLESSADFKWLKVDQGDSLASHSSLSICELNQQSSLSICSINTGSFSEITKVYSQKPQSQFVAKGLHLLKKKEITKQKVVHFHKGEKGYSRQFYRSILSDRSKNSIDSKVNIQAQYVDSNQMLQTLILSSYAKGENQPELEVSKDQVKATHGATIGQPNALEIFYMNSRGISKTQALQLMVTGWMNTIFTSKDEENKNDQWNQHIQKTLQSFLQKQLQCLLSAHSK